MKYTMLLILTLLSYFSFGQNKQDIPPPDTSKIYQIVERMPMYPDGNAALWKFIKTNIKYPDEERENKIQGRVVVRFVVERDGSISDITVVKGVSSGLDKEALRIMNLMPKFIPGQQQGVTVRVKFVLPIIFEL